MRRTLLIGGTNAGRAVDMPGPVVAMMAQRDVPRPSRPPGPDDVIPTERYFRERWVDGDLCEWHVFRHEGLKEGDLLPELLRVYAKAKNPDPRETFEPVPAVDGDGLPYDRRREEFAVEMRKRRIPVPDGATLGEMQQAMWAAFDDLRKAREGAPITP